MNLVLLNYYVKESGLRMDALAERTGCSVQSLRNKLHGKHRFTSKEAVSICKALGIGLKGFLEIFDEEGKLK